MTPKDKIEEWKNKKPFWKIELTRRTAELEIYCIPPWIGHSYYLFDIDVEVYHLVPFNRIIRAYRKFMYWLRWGSDKEKLFGKRMEVNQRSYDKGWNDAVAEMNVNGWKNFKPR